MSRALIWAAALMLLTGTAPAHRQLSTMLPEPPAVAPNDNRHSAGRLTHDTLELHLAVGLATWHPEADSGPAIHLATFREEGKSPQIPAPLIRVPAGTVIKAMIRNELTDSTIRIYGLVTRPASAHDSLPIPPGESRSRTFSAGAPGTYLYWASLGATKHERDQEQEQLAGAFVVDPAGGSPADRILVINIWGTHVDSATYTNALAINGRSWPYTERIQATVGDTLRWRVLNGSWRNHPMHLHGFYYRVESRGDGFADTLYPAAAQRLVVTEGTLPHTTYAMSWVAERPGNWLFHCHLGFHVVPGSRMHPPGVRDHDAMAQDAKVHMAGLVLGIAIQPRAGASEAPRGKARRVHLFVQESGKRGRAQRALGFVLQSGPRPPAPDSIVIPGSPLLLTRGQPTDIVVVNRLNEATAIHWHGIELESYSDGVAGWSGAGERLAPSVMPGDSFTARLTLPRAGTFMYHTHLNDIEQLTSGLYGGIVVLDRGRTFDSRRDHLFVIGWDGETRPPVLPHILINGDSLPAPLLLAPRRHRLRFVNIGPAGLIHVGIYRDTSLVTWRRIAKDGADLPPAQSIRSGAEFLIAVGETYDFELTPTRGRYRMVAQIRDKQVWSRELVVR
jgi:FtsP/CotA-like multicopper oxidase with cupredoxin domain